MGARIVILGAGFGGIAAAVELGRCLPAGHDIALVDRRDSFRMGLRHLWDLAGEPEGWEGRQPPAGAGAAGRDGGARVAGERENPPDSGDPGDSGGSGGSEGAGGPRGSGGPGGLGEPGRSGGTGEARWPAGWGGAGDPEGPDGGRRPLAAVARHGVRVVRAEVRRIDLDARSVALDSGSLPWDFLIVALGAELRPDLVPGFSEHAHDLFRPESSAELARAAARHRRGRILVLVAGAPYKCPPAPYEAALLLDAALRRRGVRGDCPIAVATPQPIALPNAGAEGSAALERLLAERGIALHTGRRIRRIEPGRAVFEAGGAAPGEARGQGGGEAGRDTGGAGGDGAAGGGGEGRGGGGQGAGGGGVAGGGGEARGGGPAGRQAVGGQGAGGDGGELPWDLLIGIPPHRCPAVVVEAGLTAGRPWVPADPRTLEAGQPGVYAIGDVVGVRLANGLPLPKAGLLAERQGIAVARRIAAEVAGLPAAGPYEGRGECYIDVGGGAAAEMAADFYAEPEPRVRIGTAGPEHLAAKRAFEAERLRLWFGA